MRLYTKEAATMAASRQTVVKLTLLFLAALTYCCLLVGVGAFQSSSSPYLSSRQKRTFSPSNVASSSSSSSPSWKHNNGDASPPFHTHFATILTAAKNKDDNSNNPETSSTASSFWERVIKEKPGTLILAPLIVFFGFELVAFSFLLAKRTIEYLAFGKLPSTEVWFFSLDKLFFP
jgi:hypothetical protein